MLDNQTCIYWIMLLKYNVIIIVISLTTHFECYQAVQDNDFETLQIEMDSISSASSENLHAIKTDVATFVSEDIGWNVFHYAADHESDSIMEELVKHLKGIGETIVYSIVTRHCMHTGVCLYMSQTF